MLLGVACGWGPQAVGKLTIPQFKAYQEGVRRLAVATAGRGMFSGLASLFGRRPSDLPAPGISYGTVSMEQDQTDAFTAAVKQMQKETGKQSFKLEDVYSRVSGKKVMRI